MTQIMKNSIVIYERTLRKVKNGLKILCSVTRGISIESFANNKEI